MRLAGSIQNRSIRQRDADKAAATFRGKAFANLVRNKSVSGPGDIREERGGDETGATELAFVEILLHLEFDCSISAGAEHRKNQREQAGVPNNQTEGKRARVHGSPSSLIV